MTLLACPFCAEEAGSASATLLVMALLLVPFVIGAIAVYTVRKLDTRETE